MLLLLSDVEIDFDVVCDVRCLMYFVGILSIITFGCTAIREVEFFLFLMLIFKLECFEVILVVVDVVYIVELYLEF